MKLPRSSISRITEGLDLDLGDPRRMRRFIKTLEAMARDPSAAFPEAMRSEAALQGGYRIVNNKSLKFDLLTEAFAAKTRKRAQSHDFVLVVHDTTTCKPKHATAEEIGFMNTGKPGFFLHYSLVLGDVFGSLARPLGISSCETIHRPKRPKKRGDTRSKKRPAQITTQNPNRESKRWWRSIERSALELKHPNIVHVADRESDSYELMQQCVAANYRFVFRTRVRARVAIKDSYKSTVGDLSAAATGVMTREIALSKRVKTGAPEMIKTNPSRSSRMAKLTYSATKVQIARPFYADKSMAATLHLNVVRAYESSPPPGEEAVDWLLYTTDPIDTPAQIARIVDIYRCRWLIEECNKALKTGCIYEQREFESRDALLAILSMSLPIACEILWLRTRARTEPNRPATDVLSERQMNIMRAMGSKLPKRTTSRHALLALAELGGFHRSNGEPGWKILARAMTQLLAWEQGWAAAEAHRAGHSEARKL